MEFAIARSTRIIHIVSERVGNYAHSICGKLEGSDTKKIYRQLNDALYDGGLQCRRCFSRS